MNNGKICVSVCAETADEMIANIKRAEEFGDVIEVRFDCLRKQELEAQLFRRTYPGPKNAIVESATKPIISTFRPKEQGGRSDLSLDERSNFWASGHETDYCDVEEELVEDTGPPWLWGNRICSYHDFSGIPNDIEAIFWRLAKTEAEKIKIAVRVNDITEAIPVWNLLGHLRPYGQLSPRKVIPIAMGEAGKWTRLLGLAHGAYLTYGALERGKETAEGQITAKDLIEVYRVKELDKETKVYGVIGDPVSESLSPYMHNAAFAAAGINAVFVPLLVKDLDAFMMRMVLPATREVDLKFAGFAVTMPHKQTVMKYLDEIDERAKQIGAVNTIKIDADGRLYGFNTDSYGFTATLKHAGSEVKRNKVAILGAGGAARGCVDALKEEGAEVTIFARDKDKAESLSSGSDTATDAISNLKFEISNFDVLVNATPLGMKGLLENDTPLTADDLKGVKLVFDLVTRSTDTPLIREAKKAGVATITGVEMLIEQGARQFEIWTGREAPVELMRTSVLKRINDGG